MAGLVFGRYKVRKIVPALVWVDQHELRVREVDRESRRIGFPRYDADFDFWVGRGDEFCQIGGDFVGSNAHRFWRFWPTAASGTLPKEET